MTTTERKSTYELVTERLAAAIEAGNVPWHKPWRTLGAPSNLVSRKPYRGINVWLTLCSGFASPWWVTFKQAQALGGTVRKGEKGTMVVYWSILRKRERNAEGEPVERRIPLLKHYWVFNAEQCDGLDAKIPAAAPTPVAPTDTHEAADALIAGWADKPVFQPEGGDRAYYVPALDIIRVPARVQFESLDAYYQTLFHEAVHATGHKNRLGRPGIVNPAGFGSEPYAEEELVAEIGACYLAELVGIDPAIDNSASYLRGWASKLRSDTRLIFRAASAAQKASDHILGIVPEVVKDETEQTDEQPAAEEAAAL